MRICPKCGRSFERLLALSRTDNETMICDECGTMEALESLPQTNSDGFMNIPDGIDEELPFN